MEAEDNCKNGHLSLDMSTMNKEIIVRASITKPTIKVDSMHSKKGFISVYVILGLTLLLIWGGYYEEAGGAPPVCQFTCSQLGCDGGEEPCAETLCCFDVPCVVGEEVTVGCLGDPV